jgi:NAD(P)-dependent dehydrogenase (short-subunit alcohol dehydrogenase family)
VTDGGRVAVVTAAAQGIGAATARAFALAGYRLVLADVDESGLDESVAACGPNAVGVRADVTSEVGADSIIGTAISTFGALDALVNVVGGSRPGTTVADLSLADWDRMLTLNLTSVFLMCRAALPHLVARQGTVVNVASGAGLRGMKANPGYVAAKAGVVGLTRALAIDHTPAGVRVNCVAPGPILTPLMRRNRTADEIAAMGRISLAGRIGDPDEIAAAILWLSGPESSYVVGQTVEVDGGVATMV